MAPPRSAKKTVHVRVMADAGAIEEIAEEISQSLEKEGAFELVDLSAVYQCRPPQEDQARIYLTLLRRMK